MLETRNPEIDVDELMARVREEATRLPEMDVAVKPVFPAPTELGQTPRHYRLPRYSAAAALEPKASYALADFLNFHDVAFVRHAYRGMLGREPDAGGLQNYLERLRAGQVSRIEILGRLRYSPEGRAKAVKVRGLLAPFAIATAGRLPLVGYPLRWLVSLLGLPTLARSFERFENYTFWWMDLSRDLFDQGMTDCERLLDDLNRIKGDAETLAGALARIEWLEKQLYECQTALAGQQQQLDQKQQ